MAAETLGSLILWLILPAIVVVIAVSLLRWLYQRSTKETAFVRTGFSGEKVVVSGCKGSREADHAGLQEIEFASPVHLAIDESEFANPPLGLTVGLS